MTELHHKNKHFYCEQVMQNLNVRKTTINCEIIKSASFQWHHHFLRAPGIHQPDKINGVVEADEMYCVRIVRHPVDLTTSQRVINGAYYIQNVNAYDNQLVQWMARLHGVATRYLKSCPGWHGMMNRLNQNMTSIYCFISSLKRMRQFQQLITTWPI